MWVNLVTPALSPTEVTHPRRPSSTLISIRWIVRQRLSEIESGLTRGNPSEEATPPDPDEECAGVRTAEAKPDALALPHSRNLSPSAPWSSAAHATVSAPKIDVEDETDLCVVCMERTPDLQLLPCRHDRFCRQCMVETICTWKRPEAPSCPLCRGAFHTMVFLQ